MNRFDELRMLLERAHAPYSGFRVAAVAVCRDGNAYEGVNVESAAYPLTLCAERVAIFHAIAAGATPGNITEIHLLAQDSEGRLVEVTPCGACRQVISEQSGHMAEIVIYNKNGDCRKLMIEKLLPDPFVG
jgi:cytidine deaminase